MYISDIREENELFRGVIIYNVLYLRKYSFLLFFPVNCEQLKLVKLEEILLETIQLCISDKKWVIYSE